MFITQINLSKKILFNKHVVYMNIGVVLLDSFPCQFKSWHDQNAKYRLKTLSFLCFWKVIFFFREKQKKLFICFETWQSINLITVDEKQEFLHRLNCVFFFFQKKKGKKRERVFVCGGVIRISLFKS